MSAIAPIQSEFTLLSLSTTFVLMVDVAANSMLGSRLRYASLGKHTRVTFPDSMGSCYPQNLTAAAEPKSIRFKTKHD
jgi:hypothetical protein